MPIRCAYRSSSGCTAIPVSPSIVSTRVVAQAIEPAAVRQRVAERDELALDVLVLDLGVREPGLVRRAPVDQSLAAVDQAVVVPADERLAHRAREPLVHRESLAASSPARRPCA